MKKPKAAESKPKPVNVEVLPETHDGYKPLKELIAAHHPHLAEARIALALNYGWKEDGDGRVRLGSCKKGSDLDRELHGYDFVISLNPDFLSSKDVTSAQKRALMDHELSHAGVSIDQNGDEKRDEHGRLVYRIVKHDVEEFTAVVARNGVYKKDLQALATVLQDKKRNPLITLAEATDKDKAVNS